MIAQYRHYIQDPLFVTPMNQPSERIPHTTQFPYEFDKNEATNNVCRVS